MALSLESKHLDKIFDSQVKYHLKFDVEVEVKCYADTRRRPLEFMEGDFVFLKVTPKRGVFRFGIKGKLAPRYTGEIIERVGSLVAFRGPTSSSTVGHTSG